MRAWALRLLLPLVALCGLLSACADDLPKATSIERMRVLGVKLEVLGDEQRATPRPGETVRVSLPTIFPELDADTDALRTLLIRCTSPTQFTGGLPICQEFLDAALGQDADVAAVLDSEERFRCSGLPVPQITLQGITLACPQGPPTAELPIPSGFAGDSALFLGVVCEQGDPYIDPNEPTLFGCEGAGEEAEAIRINGKISILRDEADDNHNPSLDSLTVYVDLPQNIPSDDAPLSNYPDWPTWDGDDDALPPVDNCIAQARQRDDDPLRHLGAGTHELRLRLDPDVREELPDEMLETLELTVYSTHGEMERRFTVFDESDELRNGSFDDVVEWEPPPSDEVGVGGQLVRFFITVRDGRGGFDLRSLVGCYRP